MAAVASCLHLLHVAFQERQPIAVLKQILVLQIALFRLLVHRLRFIQPVEGRVGEAEVGIVDNILSPQGQRLEAFLKYLFPISQITCDHCQVFVRPIVPRVNLLAQLEDLRGFLQLSGGKQIVGSLDGESLPLTSPSPAVRKPCVHSPPPRPSSARGRCSQRTTLDRPWQNSDQGPPPLVERHRGYHAFCVLHLQTQAVIFQCLQRWRCRFLCRCVVLLHRAERFHPACHAKLTAAASRALSTASLPAACSCASGQHVPRVAGHGLQANHVLAAQAGDRAGQHGLAARALTDLVC